MADDLQHYMDATARMRRRAERAESALAEARKERDLDRQVFQKSMRAEKERSDQLTRALENIITGRYEGYPHRNEIVDDEMALEATLHVARAALKEESQPEQLKETAKTFNSEQRCPTCGSDNPDFGMEKLPTEPGEPQRRGPCNDPFHCSCNDESPVFSKMGCSIHGSTRGQDKGEGNT